MDPGEDSFGKVYSTIKQMWKKELKTQGKWYNSANKYWSSQSADMHGIMGGLPEIHEADIEGSRSFLRKVNEILPFAREKALDCGCGIGRVSKYLLCDEFASVDLVDQCENFIATARNELTGRNTRFFIAGLQDFTLEPATYDCIWIQWVLSHLTDIDLLSFFTRLSTGLRPGGVIIIKENIKKKGFFLHKDDSSVTRSETLLKALITEKLNIIAEDFQSNFPESLFKVKMFACTPLSNG